MSEKTKSDNVHTTSNGYEISHPREKLQLQELREMLQAYKLDGETAAERVQALKQQPKESVALFMTDLNAKLNGSEETLTSKKTMKIGEKSTVAPEERYDLFGGLMDKIKATPDDINPARIGDALALGTVILHPFEDGNGRTARMLGYVFREGLDGPDAAADFDALAEPRDDARARGGFMINGYIPYFPEGSDQSDPNTVSTYMDTVLSSNEPNLYTSAFGQAELMTPAPEAQDLAAQTV